MKEIAEILGISCHTVYGWVSQGRIPYVKLGRRTLFQPEEVWRWVEGQAESPREWTRRGR